MLFSPPPPLCNAETLSSLTNEHVVEQTQPSSRSFQSRQLRRHTTQAVNNMGINRQSMLVFADFNSFESPGSSRQRHPHYRGEDEDYSFDPDFNMNFDPPRIDEKGRPESNYSLEKNLPQPPYHIFTPSKKKQMVYTVSLAGLFSPLSSNIYFPALGQISRVQLLSLDLSVHCSY